MFCVQCGNQISNSAAFCSHCGGPVIQPSSSDETVLRALLPIGRSGWAIAAGYLGLLSVLMIPAPLALLTGIMAVADIRKHPEKTGMGRAILGIAAGGICSLLLLAMLIIPH